MTKREEIIQIGARLFSKRGYAATSMRDLAREVGMEPASLYNHIKSKQDILDDCLMMLAQLYADSMQKASELDLSALQKLERVIHDQIDISLTHPTKVSLIPAEWVHLEKSKQQFIGIRNHYEEGFKQLLLQSIAEGDIRKVNIELTTFSILSTLRWLHNWYDVEGQLSIDELKNELTQNLIEGIST